MRLLTAFSWVCAVVASSVSVKDCAPGSIFRVSAVDFSPVTPVAGQNGTLHTVYDVPVQVDAGTARYSCTLNGLPVYDETFDLCSQTACPIGVGTHDDHSISAVPATSGKVSCKINWANTAGTQLMCIQMSLTLDAAATTKSLRGPAATYTPPKLFHSHTLEPVAAMTAADMCNISGFDESMFASFLDLNANESSTSGSSSDWSPRDFGNNTVTGGREVSSHAVQFHMIRGPVDDLA